jgi:antitoxin (DNA-binding transcriptional repressor) of toxin-antitoxin stability system
MARVITERELSGEGDALLDAVERGESFVVMRDGRAVARLGPIAGQHRRRRGVPTDEIRAGFARLPRMDYASLRADVDEFFGDDDRIRDEDYA